MGFYDDHLEAVAKRGAVKMKKYGIEWERSRLKRYGWSLEEIRKIIDIERKINEDERN